MKQNIVWIIGGIILIAIIVGGSYLANRPGKYDTFAQCLTDEGATFYGAFWCPHCLEQKRLFGNSDKKLPYVECSNPDRTQNQTCKDADITSYPTWEFADGTRITGAQSFQTLADATGCALPEDLANSDTLDDGSTSNI